MPLNLTRSILVIFVPGVVAVAPWLVWAIQSYEPVAEFYVSYPELAWAALFTIMIVFGSIAESINGRIESNWDVEREAELTAHDNWYDYLARPGMADTVANKYIGRLVDRMQSMMGMMWAVLSCAVGVATALGFNGLNCLWTGGIVIAGVAASVLLFLSSKNIHHALCATRQEVNARLGPLRAIPSAPGGPVL